MLKICNCYCNPGNQVRRLDADETNFLDFCTERQQEIKDERTKEELKIISEMHISLIMTHLLLIK